MPKVIIEYVDSGYTASLARLKKLREEKERLEAVITRETKLQVDTTQAIKGLKGAQSEAAKIEKGFKDLAAAAQRLGTTPKGIKALAREIGLTSTQVVNASALVKKLTLANTSLDQQYVVLNKTLGLNRIQVEALSRAAGSQSNSLAQVSRQLGLSVGQAQQFANSLGLTERQLATTVQRLRQFSETTSTADERFEALNRELGISRNQFNQVEGSIKKFDSSLKGTIDTARAMERAVDLSGQAAGLVRDAFRTSVQTYVEFENAIKQAGIVSEASSEELQALSDEAERLAIVTSKSPAEVGQMSVALSQAGFTAGETTASLEGVVRASEATGASLENVGDLIAKVTRAYGLQASDSEEISDILVTTVNNTNTSIETLRQSFQQLAPVANASGISLKDTALAIGLLGDAGIQAESGEVLSAFLRQVTKAANTTTESITETGALGDVLRRLSTDAVDSEGNLKSFLDLTAILNEELDGLSGTERQGILNKVFLDSGARGASVLLDASAERVDALNQKYEEMEGVSRRAGEAMLEGLGGSLDLIQGSVEGVAVRIGAIVSGPLEDIVRAANGVLGGFLELNPVIQTFLVTTAGLSGVLAAAVVATAAWEASNARAIFTLLGTSKATVLNTISTGANSAGLAVNAAATRANAFNSLSLGQVKTALTAKTNFDTAAIKANTLAQLQNIKGAAKSLGALRGLAAQAGLLIGAYVALSDINQTFNSEQAQQARAIVNASREFVEARSNVDALGNEIEKTADGIDETSGAFDDLGESLGRALDAAKDRGPLEGIRSLSVDLQSALIGGADSADRLGSSLIRIGGIEIGGVTQQQLDNQRSTLAAAKAIESMGDTVQETSDLVLGYGDLTKLSAGEIEAFTARAGDKAKALQEEIEFLKAQKTGIAEVDQQLENEIAIRERLIGTIKNKVAEAGGEVDSIEDQVDSAKELTDFLKGLEEAEKSLAAGIGLESAQERLRIAKGIADGSLSEGQAALAEAKQAEKDALATAGSINATLDDLRAKLETTTSDTERETINAEIVARETELAEAEAGIYESRTEQAEIGKENAKKIEEDRVKDLEESYDAERALLDQADADRALSRAGLENKLRDSGASRAEIERQVRDQTLKDEETALKAQEELLKRELDAYAGNTEKQAEIRLELTQVRTELAEKDGETEANRLADLEDSYERQADLLERSATEREGQIASLELALLRAGASEEDIALTTAQASLNATAEGIQAEIALLEQKFQAFAGDSEAQAEIATELAGLQVELTQNQVEQERAAREQAVEEFERSQARIVGAIETATQEYELQQQAVELINASLERQGELLQGQIETLQARQSLRDTIGQSEISDLERGREILAELNGDQEVSAERRLALEKELRELGISGKETEAGILQEIIAKEREASQGRLESFQREQQLNSLNQQIEEEKLRLAGEQAITQAQINELKAQQNVLDAEGALFKAQQAGDPQAVALAQRNLDLSRQGQALAQDGVRQAEESAASTEQRIQQQRELNALKSAESEIQLLQNERSNAQKRLQEALATGNRAAIADARAYFREIDGQLNSAVDRAESLPDPVDVDTVNGVSQQGLDLTTGVANEEERAAAAARDRLASYRELQALGGGARSESTPSTPRRKIGGPVDAGQLYEVHSNELFVPSRSGYVLNQFDTRAARRLAMADAQRMLSGQYVQRMASSVVSPGHAGGKSVAAIESQMKGLNATVGKLLKTVASQPSPSLNVQNTIEKKVDLGDLYTQQLDLLRARNRSMMRGG